MSKKKVAVCIGGYFNSFTDKRSKGVNGFEYIKENILDKAEADVFIHSWDLEHKDTMLELYEPWLKASKFEEQINFSDVLKDHGVAESSLLANFRAGLYTRGNAWKDLLGGAMSGRLPNSLSLFNTRSKSLSLRREYEETAGVKYDCVVLTRPDLGQINKGAKPNICDISFDPHADMSKFYLADWLYFNEGLTDIWFYSSPENMDSFIGMDERVIQHYINPSEGGYLDSVLNGWKYSNLNEKYSNEIQKEESEALSTKKLQLWESVNVAMYYKWEFIMHDLHRKAVYIDMDALPE
jgi:hypothetical protein